MKPESSQGDKTTFGVVCGAHFFNHFQSTMLGILYPVMMRDLGIGFVALGLITTSYNTVANLLQGFAGFVVPYVRRSRLLTGGNLLLGSSVVATGFASGLPHILAARAVGGLGASPQHPVGSSILASHFQTARGRVLAMHSAAGHLGSLLAPISVALLLTYVDWREVFWIVGVPTALMGLACLMIKEPRNPSSSGVKRSEKPLSGWSAYKKCLQNRNVVILSLILMVGAAGRGQGINETYLVPHLVNDLKVEVTQAALLFTLIQVGGFCGPFLWGWISDRCNRILTIQISLLLSGLSTLWLAWQGHVSVWLFSNLIIYGAVVSSRQTLTQALLSDIVEPEVLDAAFSVYFLIGFISIPFWTLLTGWIMSHYGFAVAFSLISTSYLIAMILLLLLRNAPPHRAAGPTPMRS
jgi:MFS family permease